ncbi:coronafacic acid synthetase [Bacillus thuringiensis]|uniref:acyl carrier protein n=2 Tax=Bacillus cereus group TaxID=86661 RepID=UPI000BFA9150|nr:coronafacic acid synthetase [Bacillus thuringiensis]PGL16707.1 coronafacic acid synthetase [Bacillus thuringiensis]
MMKNEKRIRDVLKAFAEDEDKNVEDLKLNDSILDELHIDSLKFIELVVELEQEFDIEISDEYLMAENFESISKIDELILGLYK